MELRTDKVISSNDTISSSQEPQLSPQSPAVVKPRRGSIFVSALAAEQHGASSLSTDNTGSMIVRLGRSSTGGATAATSTSSSSTNGITAVLPDSSVEGVIVTPFAQVLVSMQRIRNAFIRLTAAQVSNKYNITTVFDSVPTGNLTPDSSDYKIIANETLEELEWCLKQLENIQTKRPVSDMAFSKFKRLLNKELNSFGEADKSRHQISAYICETFLGSTGSMSTESRKSAQLNDSSGLLTTKLPSSSKLTSQNVDDGNGPFLPIHGVETPNDNELEERFSLCLDEWGVDIFEIDRLSNGHALTTVAYRIFQKRDLLKTFCIDPHVFVRYLLRVESTYHADVPYHNSMHAADVLQTAHFLLQAEALDDVFSDLEILAVLFAAAIHDVDHPGVTNQFLINTGHELALQYNDASVLENHHLYMAFKILTEKDCDIFANLGGKKRQTLRRMVIELVLATDMSKHMSLLADLRTMVETKKVSGSGMLNLDNYADRIQILQNMIHCADLSNPAKPLRLYRKWTGRLIEEFFRQGDKERELSLEISPMCDRESVEVEKSQVSFIDFVCHPLWETWCDLVHPCAQLILDTLEDNRDWYECHIKESKMKVTQLARPKLATAAEDDEEISTTSGNT
ncbi:putative camp-specific 3,5-cyclic phosphodiesterase [Schistosoma mansoni]|uniref:Phosphodiesterase n=1 Tax=Schistosoma mansoni TaxID=6183 RepID=A0ABF7PH00_SCHMA|nr:putative camp-specific 3,5-cyclic phosphodiesterase [Schistosoma mansoni]|eukprot:XP_018653888.1 putative camp-specific 3,5-cyclic phosphodiesterase [Schistosoma mansoni]